MPLSSGLTTLETLSLVEPALPAKPVSCPAVSVGKAKATGAKGVAVNAGLTDTLPVVMADTLPATSVCCTVTL